MVVSVYVVVVEVEVVALASVDDAWVAGGDEVVADHCKMQDFGS